MVVADSKVSLSISGGGDVLEPHDGVLAIGSGSPYALAAARALLAVEPSLSAREICERSMRIAADACIYTNDNFTIEEMKIETGEEKEKAGGEAEATSKKDKENRKERK
jgi:ATP-dependent HslUV protease subunit HslV